MYRGVAVQAGNLAPLTAMQMVINGALDRLITGGSGRALTEMETVACGLGAGAFSAVLYGPVDLTMIHQQKLGLPPIATLKHIAKHHGITNIWRGSIACAAREAVYTAGYLSLAPIFRNRIMQQPGWEESYWAASCLGAC